LASKPGRLFQLAWALWRLPLLRGAGEMRRLLGAPPAFAVFRERLRAVLRRLRFRSKALAHEQSPVPVLVQAEVAQSVALAADAQVVVGAALGAGSSALGNPRVARRSGSRRPAGMLHLSDRQFIQWLAQQRQEYFDHLDRYHSAGSRPWCGSAGSDVQQ